ncbi:MAG TPA: hypothetical protein VIC06_05130 [Solirubrobacteraceae bacterium]|jgi:hypothetical protein
MAYIVDRRSGTWEIRESHATATGPRSRTLASFQTFTPEVIERAQARSSKTLDPGELRNAAARAGAPIAVDNSDRASVELLSELTSGRAPRPVLRRLLADALQGDRRKPASSAQEAAAWITATPKERGEALRDLLLLTDRLPPSRAPAGRRFPRLSPRAA